MKLLKKAVAVTFVTAAILYPSPPARADQIRDLQWHVKFLDLSRVHSITKGDGVIVAVLDTGVSSHTDIAKNLQQGTDTVPGGDGVGRTDKDGHGTAMAGLIAGHGRNSGDGAIGVAPNARLLPVRASDGENSGDSLVTAIQWAAQSRAKVINVSLTTIRSRSMNEAVAEATAADIVIVAGAGNTSTNGRMGYPAAMPEVVGVGAVDRKGQHAKFSVTGSGIDICAPGVDMVSTDLGNKYSKGEGTSASTAIVSGAAALVRAKFPDLSAPEVIHRLTATATDIGPVGKDDQCGYGVLNIVKALTADVPPLTAPAGVSSGQPTGSPATADPALSATGPAGDTPSVGVAPAPEPAGSNLPIIMAGVGAGIVAAGALVALLVARRRRPGS
ncbi:S8 family serine peptidase [Actinoplanes utahensis]|uniref:S8 family serine peptidase n=1 Tax=Actinoplanes utahensis TaxID=1869 RepID=UPI00126A2724|nr:S8 family serine peptidase [Actinoplanes utahensis]GIF29147.1 type VII secretion-associated serine protease [Actinoplanes utahensis]